MIFLESLFVHQLHEEREIEWHTRWHTHRQGEYEIHYVTQGAGGLRIKDRQFSLTPGTLIIIPPDMEHGIIYKDTKESLSYYAILFSLESNDFEIKRQLELLEIGKRSFHLRDTYRFFFEELRRRGASHRTALRFAAKHQLATLFFLLNEDTSLLEARDKRIEQALQIMQNHIHRDLSLQELSSQLGITTQYCIQIFKERMGITPMRYLRKLKIETAEALLTDTNRSLREIAEDLGFYSEFHFSRVFKQYTREAPSRYRRRHRATSRRDG